MLGTSWGQDPVMLSICVLSIACIEQVHILNTMFLNYYSNIGNLTQNLIPLSYNLTQALHWVIIPTQIFFYFLLKSYIQKTRFTHEKRHSVNVFPTPAGLFLLFLKTASWEDEIPQLVKDACPVSLTIWVRSSKPTRRWKERPTPQTYPLIYIPHIPTCDHVCTHMSHHTNNIIKRFYKLKIFFLKNCFPSLELKQSSCLSLLKYYIRCVPSSWALFSCLGFTLDFQRNLPVKKNRLGVPRLLDHSLKLENFNQHLI